MPKSNDKKITANVKNINVGVVIIALIFLYLVIYVISGLRKEHISIYEVQAISMSRDCSCEAVILRNEENFYTSAAGYTNYYVRNGSRIAVGDTLYSIDESHNAYDYLNSNGIECSITEDDLKQIKKPITEFNSKYNSNNFEYVYNLKNDLLSEYSNISDSYLLNNLGNIIDSSASNSTFNIFKAEKSGTISFFDDSLAGLTGDQVNTKTFDKTNYTSKFLYETDLKEANALAYKIVNDESWSIIINLSKEQYEELSSESTISFTIKNDGLQLTKPCTYYTWEDGYFARVDLTEYMIRYLKYRFLNITLKIDSEKGLKIPYSSITEKEFYTIPSEYYIHNEETDEDGFTIMEYDIATKETRYRFIAADIYYENPETGMLYVDTNTFEYGQYVYSMTNESLYQVSVIKKLEGCYNVNKGYAIFRRIEVLSKNEDYCIIKSGLKHGLSSHDHIALHANLIDENVQIY